MEQLNLSPKTCNNISTTKNENLSLEDINTIAMLKAKIYELEHKKPGK